MLKAPGRIGRLGSSLAAMYTGTLSRILTPNIALLTPHTDGTISLTDRGTDGVTTSTVRATTGWVPDHENVYRLAASGEARIAGARRVVNLLNQTDAFGNQWAKTNGTLSTGVSDPNGGSTAVTWTATNVNALLSITNAAAGRAGDTYIGSIWIRRRTGSGVIQIRGGGDTTDTITSVVTTSWQRVASSANTSSSASATFRINLGSSGDAVDLWHPQSENLTGRTDQTNPSEFVANTGAVGTVGTAYFYTTNGNTVASNVVTEATGSELRPTRTVTVGGYTWKHFDSYKPWEASESGIAVGDRRLPLTRSGNAAAVTYAGASPTGYYYECTAITTGTCDGTEPAWPETLTNTVVDGGVTWTCQGLYTLSGLMVEQAATNSILQSRAFTTTPWGVSGTPTSAQTEVGFDGSPSGSGAWVLGDDDATASEFFRQTVTVPDDSNTHCFSIYVKKDADEARFPAFQFQVFGGTAQIGNAWLNTKTGAVVLSGVIGTFSAGVVDDGDWWRLYATVANNSTGNTSARVTMYPALGTVIGTADVAATGTCVVDHAQLYLNTSTLPATPGLATTTTAATRNADDISLPEPAWFDTAGTVLVDGKMATGTTLAYWINTATNVGPLVSLANNDVRARDGTGQAIHSADVTKAARLGGRWSGSTMAVVANNGTETTAAYDGNFGGTTITLEGSTQGATMLNVILLNTDIGATDLVTATARDAA